MNDDEFYECNINDDMIIMLPINDDIDDNEADKIAANENLIYDGDGTIGCRIR